MTTEQAAEIIKVHIAERDKKAAAEGLTSTAYNLRCMGDAVNAYTEVLADDVLAGYGVDQATARHLIRVAKMIEAMRRHGGLVGSVRPNTLRNATQAIAQARGEG